MKLEQLKKLKVPDRPGVYFFKRGKNILYIGKATSLRGRVRSYFGPDLINTRGVLAVDMVRKADRLSWQESDSVLEALILEANLIKKYQPYYNIREKDDKSFNYVCITKGKIPVLELVRGKNLIQHDENPDSPFAKIYGPFTNGGQLQAALKIIRPIFPYLDAKSKNYLGFYTQVGWVPDIATPTGLSEYRKNIKNLKLFLEGKKKKVLKNLRKEMMAHAKKKEFERAGEVKRQIFALKHINDVALIKSSPHPSPLLDKERGNSTFRIEAYDIAHLGGKNMVGVMTAVENGLPVKSEYKKFRIRTQSGTNDTGALFEVLERRLRHQEWGYPALIVVDGGMAQLNAAKAVLVKMDLKIKIVAVVKDERHKPKAFLGDEEIIRKYKSAILLANSEAHRFAIRYHKNLRARNFLK